MWVTGLFAGEGAKIYSWLEVSVAICTLLKH